eukprot:TRINITY_DN7055_c0_g1_i1.p1 TRINITY_DN7055_c0_g1~~TRINITY_DN7055_c0_g1_i1.p1  ORF type:complete len:212 (+),score=6.39 TRINITY_DN7055_c0_g1_i1:198-833(+)
MCGGRHPLRLYRLEPSIRPLLDIPGGIPLRNPSWLKTPLREMVLFSFDPVWETPRFSVRLQTMVLQSQACTLFVCAALLVWPDDAIASLLFHLENKEKTFSRSYIVRTMQRVHDDKRKNLQKVCNVIAWLMGQFRSCCQFLPSLWCPNNKFCHRLGFRWNHDPWMLLLAVQAWAPWGVRRYLVILGGALIPVALGQCGKVFAGLGFALCSD